MIYLQPTSPVRKKNQLINALNYIIKKNLNASWSVSKIDNKFHPFKILKIKNNSLNVFFKEGKKIKSRQELNDCYIRNGIFYIFKINELLKNKSIFFRKIHPSITSYRYANIDNMNDLKIAKKIMKKTN